MAVMSGPLAAVTSGPAVMCWAISIALLAPGLTRLMLRLLDGPVRSAFGLPGYLAVRTLRHNVVKFASVVTPIMLAVGMALANFYSQTTLAEAEHRNFADSLRADVIVSSRIGGLPPGLLDQVAGTPGVAAASEYVTSAGWIDDPVDGSHTEAPWPMRGFTAGQVTQLTGATPVAGSFADLRGDTIALPHSTADRLHRQVGDVITVRLGDGVAARLTVVAVYPAPEGFETLILPAGLLATHSVAGAVPQILVRADSGIGSDKLVASLRDRLGVQPGLDVGGRSGLTTFTAQGQAEAWVNYLLVGMITGYAAIAVVNSLVASTNERRRQLGMQRLVGATRRQTLQSLCVEAGVLAFIGTLLGGLASIATLFPLSIVVLGRPMPSGPLWIGLIVVVGAIGLALLATLLPGRRVVGDRPPLGALTAD
ncbi:ABC transporter permease [Plantactinospora sp. GCM10030261]|uniref:ABC transporter permease n=1 Tax=Plantactinospora sp. GCM10030261 TaxID=3273420 RepID=UPI00360B5460